MANNNEKPIGEDTGSIRPSVAVRNFAAGTVEYSMLGLDQIVSRLPLMNNAAISAAKRITEINSLVMSGSFSRTSLKENIDEYESVTKGIREKKVDMGTYSKYRDKISNIGHDVDYALILKNKDLTTEKEESYRDSKRTEFLSQLPVEPFSGLNKKFYPDAHWSSTILERQFEAMVKESTEEKVRRSEEDYVKYIEERERILGPILDDRPTKDKVPVVLYMPKPIESIEDKIKKGVLRTKEDWNNTTWAEAMGSFERLFPEQHKEEIAKIQEEIKKDFYGTVSILETGSSVLQKLGLV
jgi:hypothetical protein